MTDREKNKNEGIIGGMMVMGKLKYLGKKPTPLPLLIQ
jgi:hypothetical protein